MDPTKKYKNLLLVFFFLRFLANSAAAGAAGTAATAATTERTFLLPPPPPSPCVLDSYRRFNWVHIGYVPYFNISNRSPIFCTTDECLDGCTADCTCTSVVYDVPHDSCYVYHDYIPVSAIEIHPVMPLDTMSVYLKVQRGGGGGGGGSGSGGYFYSSAPAAAAPQRWILAAAVAALLLGVLS